MYGYDYKLNGQVISATTDGWLNQGSEAPFGAGFLTGGNGKYGYAVYAGTAYPTHSDDSKVTLNIQIVVHLRRQETIQLLPIRLQEHFYRLMMM